MRNTKGRWIGGLALVGAAAVHAQDKGCILLKTEAQIEQPATDAQGHPTTRLVAVVKIAPGDEVIYTVSATNICAQPVEGAVIDNPVPEHMTYVGRSAIGPGTEVSFSVDGGFQFAKPELLEVASADASKRPAVAADYTHIRWVMRRPLKPGAIAFARFRAVFEQ